MRRTRRGVIAGLGMSAALSTQAARAQLGTILGAPVTLIDRALSARERDLTLAHLRSIAGVRRVVDYIEVRPRSQ